MPPPAARKRPRSAEPEAAQPNAFSAEARGGGAAAAAAAAPPPPSRDYARAPPLRTLGLHAATKDKKLHRQAKAHGRHAAFAAQQAAATELLLDGSAGLLEPEGAMERTYRLSQPALAREVGLAVARKGADFSLDFGPYACAFTRNGRHMVVGGARGHLAVVDWQQLGLAAELNVGERVHDVTFLHNSSLFAAAQRRYVHIYDHSGAEVHVLRGHQEPLALEFLPHHFLLASVGTAGYLKYQDVSTGALVAEHRTRLGACSVLRQNPWNAVLCAGHSGGAVTMWTPNMSVPVAKLAAHRGGVTALAVDAGGRYLVSAGGDARLKVWDIRRWREVHDYFTPVPAHALDVSQRGLVAVGFGSHVQVWGRDFALEGGHGSLYAAPGAAGSGGGGGGGGPLEQRSAAAAAAGVRKAQSPYMRHELPGRTVGSVRFRPYDDLLAVAHCRGVSTLLVPGAGEPNYDSLVADPFEGKKARQEAEVHALLDKIPATMISLDPSRVAALDTAPKAVKAKEAREATAAEAEKAAARLLEVRGKKRRGIRKVLKRAANVVTEQRLALEAKLKERKAAEAEALKGGGGGGGGAEASGSSAGRSKGALTRFY